MEIQMRRNGMRKEEGNWLLERVLGLDRVRSYPIFFSCGYWLQCLVLHFFLL